MKRTALGTALAGLVWISSIKLILNTHIESISHLDKTIATIGLDSLVIVDTPDALLVAERNKGAGGENIVASLKSSCEMEITDLPRLCIALGVLMQL